MIKNKAVIRAEYQQSRNKISRDDLLLAEDRVFEHLMALEVLRSASSIAVYAAIGNELPVSSFVDTLLKEKKEIYFPFYNNEKNRYSLQRITDLDLLKKGHLNVPESRCDDNVPSPDTLDAILVPGVAFDLLGNRLGRGGGYYDQILGGTKGVRIGIAYHFQVYKGVLPSEAHDVRMDYLVTDQQCYAFGL